MIRGRRLLLYALLALAVPLPALALQGGEQAPASLSVSASLGGCGLASTTIMCEIDASWNSVDGADSYTASVTAPDGSVTDFGSVGAGSASVYVPYAGDGTYSVQVTAWGQPPEPGDQPPVVARESSSPAPDPGAGANDGVDPGTLSVKPGETDQSSAETAGNDPGSDAATPTTPDETTTTPTDPAEPPTDCTTPETTTPATTTADPGATTEDDADAADSSAEETTTTTQTPPPPPPADPACP